MILRAQPFKIYESMMKDARKLRGFHKMQHLKFTKHHLNCTVLQIPKFNLCFMLYKRRPFTWYIICWWITEMLEFCGRCFCEDWWHHKFKFQTKNLTSSARRFGQRQCFQYTMSQIYFQIKRALVKHLQNHQIFGNDHLHQKIFILRVFHFKDCNIHFNSTVLKSQSIII